MKKSKKITGIAGATLIGTTVFYLKTRRKAKKERTKKEQIQQKENQQEQKKQSQKKSILAHRPGFYEKYIKRPQDFCCALAAIIVLSPVMLVTEVLVRTKLGSPVIFKQERPERMTMKHWCHGIRPSRLPNVLWCVIICTTMPPRKNNSIRA